MAVATEVDLSPGSEAWSKLVSASKVLDRLGKHFEVTDVGCWAWTGHVNPRTGYGQAWWRGTNALAHRAVYTEAVGEIPEGLHIDHLCRNRRCVNPAHLEPVTPRENALRGESASAKNARSTHCINGHEFTEANTYLPPGRRQRQCRRCKLDRQNTAQYKETRAAWDKRQKSST